MSSLTVVIAGAGYGGLAAAHMLAGRSRDMRVILIDQHDYHLLQFQLHEAAVNKIDTRALAIPLRELLPRGVDFLQARITGFDFRARTVRTEAGEVHYDRLIVALGGQTATYNIPGLDEHALMLKSLRDARRIRGHLVMKLSALGSNGMHRPYPIVVGGAGITGVELAAELAEGVRDLAREFALGPRDLRIVLLEAAPSILPGFDVKTAAEAMRVLKRLGVDIRTHTLVERVGADRIVVKSNNLSEVIESSTFIWTGGVQANWLVMTSGLSVGQRSAALVDEHLRCVDYADVSIIGDSALARDSRNGQIVIPCGQLAKHQGDYVARDILAEVRGKARRSYVPHMDGLLISLGGQRGVGQVGPVWVRHLIARWSKSAAELRYLYYIGGLRLLAVRSLSLQHGWVRVYRSAARFKGELWNLRYQRSQRYWSSRLIDKQA